MRQIVTFATLALLFLVGGCKRDEGLNTPKDDPRAVDLGLSVKWAICNVGAENPEDFGDYFAWGETAPKSEYTEENCSTYLVKIEDFSGNPQYDAAAANWGNGWRVPTRIEQNELFNKCTWERITVNGVVGMQVTGPNGKSIFLPSAGYNELGYPQTSGSYGYYWSSTPGEEHGYLSYGLLIKYDKAEHSYRDWRYMGLSVRAVKDKKK